MTSEQVSDLCSQAVAARQDGNHQLALHKYEEIIKINPNYLAAYIETGVELTKLERYSEAEERFRQVLKNEPNHRGVLVAYAASARRQGKRELALKRFEDVIDKHPNYLEGYIEVGIELGELGRYLEAEERFQQVLKKKPNHVIASIHRQCYKFLFDHTPQTIKSKLEVIKSYRSEEDLIELKDYLASRIKHHKPTSAIRLGDGEGNVLALCLKSLDKYKDFKFNCLKRSLGIWFGANRQFTDHEFLVEISQELQSVIDNSDVIGMPYFSRIQQEYRRDNRGYSGVADVVNYFYDFREKASSKVIANSNFHILFHKYDLYKSLLRDLDFCGLITCHRELAEKVRSLFAIKNIRSYYIPGEKCQYKILSTESLFGTHYPNRYRELIKELEVPFEGACFLVAGGILGKLYCNLIKNQGGIALDIGSAADLWMGYKTRDFSVLESR